MGLLCISLCGFPFGSTDDIGLVKWTHGVLVGQMFGALIGQMDGCPKGLLEGWSVAARGTMVALTWWVGDFAITNGHGCRSLLWGVSVMAVSLRVARIDVPCYVGDIARPPLVWGNHGWGSMLRSKGGGGG